MKNKHGNISKSFTNFKLQRLNKKKNKQYKNKKVKYQT